MNMILKSLTLLSFFVFTTQQDCQATQVADQTAFNHIDIHCSFNTAVASHFERILKKFNAISPKFQVNIKNTDSSIDEYDKIIEQQNSAQRSPLVWISREQIPKMYRNPDAYRPLENFIRVNRHDFIPVIYHCGSSPLTNSKTSQLISLPFACSTSILFFNKTAFKEAGLDPKSPPRTWEDIEKAIIQLKKVGYTGLAITGNSMALLENFSALHDLPLIQHQEVSAFQDFQTTLQTKPYQDFLMRLAQWHKDGLYVASEKDDKIYDDFAEGNIAIILADAQEHEMLMEKMKKASDEKEPFKLGVGPYPYMKSLVSKPFALPVKGDTLWILSKHESDQKGITSFLNYLMSPEVQAEWHQRTGYLPMSHSAYRYTQNLNFYKTHPVHRISYQQTIDRPNKSSQTSVQWHLTDLEQKNLINSLGRILAGEDIHSELDSLKEVNE